MSLFEVLLTYDSWGKKAKKKKMNQLLYFHPPGSNELKSNVSTSVVICILTPGNQGLGHR